MPAERIRAASGDHDGGDHDAAAVTARGDAGLEALLDSAGELAALPHVLLRLLQITSDPRASAAEMERVIQLDPAIAARVLATANSAYFGVPRRVCSVREAVVFLGFRTVRGLALAVGAINMFLGRTDALSEARAQLWHHSLDVALAARRTAGWLNARPAPGEGQLGRVDPDEAFTAGLLHDIGKMALDLALPERAYAAAQLTARRGLRYRDIEGQLFPYSHTAAGGALARRWQLPDALADALAYHHDPAAAPPPSAALVGVVAVANELTGYLAQCADGPDEIAQAAPALCPAECLAAIGIRPDEVPELILALRAELERGQTLHHCL